MSCRVRHKQRGFKELTLRPQFTVLDSRIKREWNVRLRLARHGHDAITAKVFGLIK